MEDIIEEIVGDIQDEFDNEREDIVALGDGIWLCDARVNIQDLNEEIGSDFPVEEFDTLGDSCSICSGRSRPGTKRPAGRTGISSSRRWTATASTPSRSSAGPRSRNGHDGTRTARGPASGGAGGVPCSASGGLGAQAASDPPALVRRARRRGWPKTGTARWSSTWPPWRSIPRTRTR